MKKSLVALAALTATGAFAQSTATISGNMSFGHIVNTARTAAATGGITKTSSIGPVDNFNANRITLTASEDLGGGLRATGVIDNRLTTANTARNSGDMFIRVQAPFGTVQVGQYTFASHAGWNAGASRAVSATATAAQSLTPNVISYTSPTIGGLTAAAALDFDVSTGGVGKDGWGLKFNYAAGPLAAQMSYTTASKTTATMTPIKVTGLAASYDFGIAKVFYNQTDSRAGNNSTTPTSAGYLPTSATAGTGSVSAHKGNSLSVSIPMGAASLKAGFVNRKGDTNATIVDRATVGVDYALSKRTSLVAEFGQDKQAVTGADRAMNSFVGLTHSF